MGTKVASLVIFLIAVVGCKSNKELGFKMDSNAGGVSGCLRLHDDGLYFKEVQVGMTSFYSYGRYEKENGELLLMPFRKNKLFVSEMRMATALTKFVINTNLDQSGLSVSFYEEGVELMDEGYYYVDRMYEITSQNVDSITITTGIGETYGARIYGENYYYAFFLDYYSHGNFFFDSDTVRLTSKEGEYWVDHESGEQWIWEKRSNCPK